MKVLKFFVGCMLVGYFCKLQTSQFSHEPYLSDVIKVLSFEHFSNAQVREVSHLLERDNFAHSQMLQDRVWDLLLIVSIRCDVIRQIVMGNKTYGIIFYIGNCDGSFVERLDPNLVSAVEDACKSFGARSISAVHSFSMGSLTQCPGYLVKSQSGGLLMIHKELES